MGVRSQKCARPREQDLRFLDVFARDVRLLREDDRLLEGFDRLLELLE